MTLGQVAHRCIELFGAVRHALQFEVERGVDRWPGDIKQLLAKGTLAAAIESGVAGVLQDLQMPRAPVANSNR